MKMNKVLFLSICFVFLFSFVSAGVGIKWNAESIVIDEKGEGCLVYHVYNPWPEDSVAVVSLSEGISDLMKNKNGEEVFVPAETSSKEALPVEFCFKVGRVYERDCLLPGGLLCQQMCEGDMEVYEGEVVVSGSSSGSVSGSATKASVSAPIRVRVRCNTSSRNYTPVYAFVVIMALIGIYLYLKRRRGRKGDRNRRSLGNSKSKNRR